MRIAHAGPLLCAALLTAQQHPPTQKELDALVAAWVAADEATESGRQQRASLLEQLAGVSLDRAGLAAWRKKLDRLGAAGRTLEVGDDQWFWPEPAAGRRKSTGKSGGKASGKTRAGQGATEDGADAQRGRYLVGGRTKKPQGLVIELHGGSQPDWQPDAGAFAPVCEQLGWVMVAPQVLAMNTTWDEPANERFVLALLDAALRTFAIDPDRVVLCGHSMGGVGTWVLGARHADRFAALGPSAGAPAPIREAVGGPVVDMQGCAFPSLRNLFVGVVHAVDDPLVPIEESRFAIGRLAALTQRFGGFDHHFDEVRGTGHGAPPGGYAAQLGRLCARRREPVPARVVWQPDRGASPQFHWLWWDEPKVDALVVADLDRATNTVSITCERDTEGLWVLLDDRVLKPDRDVVVTVNGSETFRGRATPDLGTLVATGLRPDRGLAFHARVPAFTRP